MALGSRLLFILLTYDEVSLRQVVTLRLWWAARLRQLLGAFSLLREDDWLFNDLDILVVDKKSFIVLFLIRQLDYLGLFWIEKIFVNATVRIMFRRLSPASAQPGLW